MSFPILKDQTAQHNENNKQEPLCPGEVLTVGLLSYKMCVCVCVLTK